MYYLTDFCFIELKMEKGHNLNYMDFQFDIIGQWVQWVENSCVFTYS